MAVTTLSLGLGLGVKPNALSIRATSSAHVRVSPANACSLRALHRLSPVHGIVIEEKRIAELKWRNLPQ
jgi:hypothetical protein